MPTLHFIVFAKVTCAGRGAPGATARINIVKKGTASFVEQGVLEAREACWFVEPLGTAEVGALDADALESLVTVSCKGSDRAVYSSGHPTSGYLHSAAAARDAKAAITQRVMALIGADDRGVRNDIERVFANVKEGDQLFCFELGQLDCCETAAERLLRERDSQLGRGAIITGAGQARAAMCAVGSL